MIVCGLSSGTRNIEYPLWTGPSQEQGNYTTYSNQGSATFNPNVEILTRAKWADNKRDVVLSPAKWIDEGGFQCYFADVGNWFFRLNVRGDKFLFQNKL